MHSPSFNENTCDKKIIQVAKTRLNDVLQTFPSDQTAAETLYTQAHAHTHPCLSYI